MVNSMINGVNLKVNIDDYILSALKEDITSDDVTTNAVMPEAKLGHVDLICKQDGIICGLEVFERTFKLLDENCKFTTKYKDGDVIKNGDYIGEVIGDIRVLLSGERVALNYLQRMSGIATYTSESVAILKGSKTKLLDTRKTTPNNRIFEKYAVRVGGGHNHRYNLSDGVLIKDNHIGAAGGVRQAVEMARAYAPFVRKIEIEVENLEMFREALDAGAETAVAMAKGRAETECSGNMTRENIEQIRDIGVDYVSSGALTHSAPILDVSLKNLHPIE